MQTATRPAGPAPTTQQLALLRALNASPATFLRWHSNWTPANPRLLGRGQLLGTRAQPPIRGNVVETMISRGWLTPRDKQSARPFREGGPHRDYTVSDKGRAVLKFHEQFEAASP